MKEPYEQPDDAPSAEQLLRLAKKRMSSLIRSLPIGIAIVSPAGSIEAVNPAIVSLFQYEEHELVGQNIAMLFKQAPWGEGLEEASLMSWFHSKKDQFVALEGWTKEQEVVPIDFTVRQLESGSQQRLLAIAVDVTQRFLSDQLKREFLSMISHDIRIPLSGIKTFLDMLDSSSEYALLTEVGRSRLDLARLNADRIMALVGQILDLEQLESDTISLAKELTSIRSIVEDSIASVDLVATAKQISVQAQLEDAFILCDAFRITQVVVNLLANAVDHSPTAGAVTVTVRRDGDSLSVSVQDCGPGIPDSARPFIFDRFRQVQSAQSRARGYGLGLAICRQIIQLHSGKIGYAPSSGGGSIFWFMIPFTAPDGTRYSAE